MVGRHTSIRIINQILDLLSEQTVPESGFLVSQLIERGNVRHALKEVSLFATRLLSQIPLQGIERDDIILKTLITANNNNSIQHIHAICQHKQLW